MWKGTPYVHLMVQLRRFATERRLSLRQAMTVETITRQIKEEGYCVIGDVIPSQAANNLRESLSSIAAEKRSLAERREAEIKTKGHRVGTPGVTNIVMLIHETPEFAAYLADPRVLGAAKALLGPYVRISSAGGLVNASGNARGYWHADWPFNQTNASHIATPYADAIMHLTTIWMLSPFNAQTGGTLMVPGSHRESSNPTGDNGVDRDAPHPEEVHATGEPGSVLMCDSRLWHAVPPNRSGQPRVAMSIGYAPWWLNLNPEMAGTPENESMVVETGGKSASLPPLRREVYDSLPDNIKPLFRHAVRR